MVLEEIRLMAKKKKESLDSNPNTSEASKNYFDTVWKMLSNTDYLIESPKSLIIELLYFVGYDFEQLENIYNELMKELKKKYNAIDIVQVSDSYNKTK